MRRVLRWLQPILALVALIFIAGFLWRQWPELMAYPWQLSPGWLGLSAMLMLASWAVEIGLWVGIQATLGARLPYFTAARIWFMSAVVRYVPGNIWQPLSMTLYGAERGLRPELTLTSVVLYQVVITLAAAPLAAAYFWLTGNWGLLTSSVGAASPVLIVLMMTPVVVFLIWPGLLLKLLNRLLVWVGRAPLEAGLDRWTLLIFLAVAAVDWVLWGSAFAALTFGLTEFTRGEMVTLAPHLIVSYAIASVVGFLAFLTPSGFGVREGALYLLLATVVLPPVATASALAMRAWTVIGELIMAGLAVAVRGLDKPTENVAISVEMEQEVQP